MTSTVNLKIGDLVLCQNGIGKSIGVISSRDPDYPSDKVHLPLQPEDYVWVILYEHNFGQQKWTKVKNLEAV